MFAIIIRNETQSRQVTHPLNPHPEVDTRACVFHVSKGTADPGDHLRISLNMVSTELLLLGEFVIPVIHPDTEEHLKTTTVKHKRHMYLSMDAEFHRARIDSRNKEDLRWELNRIVITVEEQPTVLVRLLDYLKSNYAWSSAITDKEHVQAEIADNMKDERRLQLALLDIKASLTAKRKKLLEVEKALIPLTDHYETNKAAFEGEIGIPLENGKN